MINELRKLIQAHLKTITDDVYYQIANDDALFPHIVFTIEGMTLLTNDLNRKNYNLTIDVYTLNDVYGCEKMAEDVEDMLLFLNDPEVTILPTFFLTSKRLVIDENKDIDHRQLEFEVQTYRR